jgi:hypothetical protein
LHADPPKRGILTLDTTWLIVLGLIAAITVPVFLRRTAVKISGDAKTIAHLAKSGADITKPHEIDFFFYFLTQEAAERIAPQLIALGLTAKIDRAAKGTSWVIHGTKTLVPSVTAMEN